MKFPFSRKPKTMPESEAIASLVQECRDHVAQIESLFTQLRRAKAQRDEAITKVNELQIGANDKAPWWSPKETS